MTEIDALITKARAVADDAGFSVRDVVPEPLGRAHHVFRLSTAEGVFFVKLTGSPRPRFATEVAALRALADDTHTPELMAFGADHIVTRSLGPGRPIRPDDTDGWRGFGGWLRRLHDRPANGLGLRYDTDPLPLSSRLAASLESVADSLGAYQREVDAVLAELSRAALAARFIHRDLRADNVVVGHDGEFIGVVDLEHAAGGPPAWDLVKALDWNAPNKSSREAFEAGYGPLPNHELFVRFEALMTLSHPRLAELYGDWARSALD